MRSNHDHHSRSDGGVRYGRSAMVIHVDDVAAVSANGDALGEYRWFANPEEAITALIDHVKEMTPVPVKGLLFEVIVERTLTTTTGPASTTDLLLELADNYFHLGAPVDRVFPEALRTSLREDIGRLFPHLTELDEAGEEVGMTGRAAPEAAVDLCASLSPAFREMLTEVAVRDIRLRRLNVHGSVENDRTLYKVDRGLMPRQPEAPGPADGL